MAIFALADLHLAHGTDKPMGVFGAHWENHEERIRDAWTQTVTQDDTVLIPGDISWAMNLKEALPDLRFIEQLPGRKILSKGNHDYWWGTNGKVESFLRDQEFSGITLLKNNAFIVEDSVICGSRGWTLPQDPDFSTADRVIFDRECRRLRLSLEEGLRLKGDSERRMIAALHFPPLMRNGADTEFSRILESFGVAVCVYGHLHGRGHKIAYEGEKNGVVYHLTAGDYISFKPLRL